jgi:hypothetical protein
MVNKDTTRNAAGGRTVVRPFTSARLGSHHVFVIDSRLRCGISNGTIAAVPVLNPDNSKAGTEKETKTS